MSPAQRPLHLCRELREQLVTRTIKAGRAAINIPNVPEILKAMNEGMLHAAQAMVYAIDGAGVKFQLPDNGKLLHDTALKALDDDAKLSLPFPSIILEYAITDHDDSREDVFTCSRRVVFARETVDHIHLCVAAWLDDMGYWQVQPELKIPRKGALGDVNDRNWRRINFEIDKHSALLAATGDYGHELVALMELLNALGCSNVHIDRTIPQKPKKGQRLGFKKDDVYRYLTVGEVGQSGNDHGGTHVRPRAHLRRGHIRRWTFKDGVTRPIWINACAVGIGDPIRRDYVVKKAA